MSTEHLLAAPCTCPTNHCADMRVCLPLQPPDLREGDEHGHAMAARLHAVEKHLRKNPLQGGTFYDKLQRSTCAFPQASPTCAILAQQRKTGLQCLLIHSRSCLRMNDR